MGTLSGTIATTVGAYYEVRDKAGNANRKTEASYETLAPAIQELQGLLDEAMEWSEDLADEVTRLENNVVEYEERIARLEIYIEDLPSRRVPLPPMPMISASKLVLFDDSPDKTRKSARHIPDSLDEAQVYQEQRVQLACPQDDPLCGQE